MITFGILEGVGFSYYAMMLIIFFLLPIVPILVSSFIIILIMKFTNIIKNKDFVQYVSVAISMIFIIVIQILVSTGTNGEVTIEQFEETINKANGMVELYAKNFITLEPAMNALSNFDNIQGLKSISIFISETVIMYFLMLQISSKLYLKGLIGVNYGSRSKKKIENSIINIKENKISISYIKKEFKMLVKNPVYFMQCVLPPILFPVIFSLPIYFSITNTNDMDLPEISEMMEMINSTTGIGIVLSLISFMFIFNFISLTAISRDGKNSIFMKYIPISLYSQCSYKVMPSIILNFIPILYSIIVAMVLLKLNIASAIAIFIVSVLLNIFESYLMILVDLNRPKLEWTTEYAVVKQNFNMIYQMVFGTITIIMFIAVGNLINNIITIAVLYSVLFLIGIYLVKQYIKNNEVKLFRKITL